MSMKWAFTIRRLYAQFFRIQRVTFMVAYSLRYEFIFISHSFSKLFSFHTIPCFRSSDTMPAFPRLRRAFSFSICILLAFSSMSALRYWTVCSPSLFVRSLTFSFRLFRTLSSCRIFSWAAFSSFCSCYPDGRTPHTVWLHGADFQSRYA